MLCRISGRNCYQSTSYNISHLKEPPLGMEKMEVSLTAKLNAGDKNFSQPVALANKLKSEVNFTWTWSLNQFTTQKSSVHRQFHQKLTLKLSHQPRLCKGGIKHWSSATYLRNPCGKNENMATPWAHHCLHTSTGICSKPGKRGKGHLQNYIQEENQGLRKLFPEIFIVYCRFIHFAKH